MRCGYTQGHVSNDNLVVIFDDYPMFEEQDRFAEIMQVHAKARPWSTRAVPPTGWASRAAALSRRALALSLRFDAQVFSLNIPRRLTKMWSLMKEDDGFVCFKDVTAGNPPGVHRHFPRAAHTCAHPARHPRSAAVSQLLMFASQGPCNGRGRGRASTMARRHAKGPLSLWDLPHLRRDARKSAPGPPPDGQACIA